MVVDVPLDLELPEDPDAGVPAPEPTSDPGSTPGPSPSGTPTVPPVDPDVNSRERCLTPAQLRLLGEQRLSVLGMPTGPKDGSLDLESRRGLCAWRDLTSRRTSRDKASQAELIALINSTGVPRITKQQTRLLGRLGLDLARPGALVNLTCQVTYWQESRTVVRVLPVSTGMDNGFHRTRSGLKTVYWKYNGWQASSLFPEPDGRPGLYRPVYFDRGIAFHGVRKPILTKPQSHGCVRTWPTDQDWLYPRLTTGTKVWVYGDYWVGKGKNFGVTKPTVIDVLS